jgi:hypothetical protein
VKVELYDKEGETPTVAPHPTFLDYLLRDSTTETLDAVVEIADDNTVTAFVKTLEGMPGREAHAHLTACAHDLVEAYPQREDGARALSLLIGWTQRYPDARISTSGADDVPAENRFLDPWIPRVARSIAVDPQVYEFLTDPFERMDEVSPSDTGSLLLHSLQLDDSEQDIRGEKLLHKENRPKTHGNRTSGRVKKKDRKRNLGERNADTDRSLQDDGRSPKEAMFQRVSPEAKRTFDEKSPSEKRDIFETVARCMRAGRSTTEIIAALERTA